MSTIVTIPASQAASASSATDVADDAVGALTAAAAAGDRDAYIRLFHLRCDFVEQEAHRRLFRRRHLADDAVQETWIRIARAPAPCDSPAKLDAWLRRVVASVVIDLLRNELARKAREDRVARSRHEAIDFVQGVELLEESRRELDALTKLPTDDQRLLELRARTGATLTHLAAMLGISRSAADSRIRRATLAARKSLDGDSA
jgi:RNA polymerase sigma factor (sigma-70 family)